MIPSDKIGKWTARNSIGRNRMTLYHLVESTIMNRVVTKCGRQLHKWNDDGDLFFVDAVPDEAVCQKCLSRA